MGEGMTSGMACCQEPLRIRFNQAGNNALKIIFPHDCHQSLWK
jgi:hypothetical protein